MKVVIDCPWCGNVYEYNNCSGKGPDQWYGGACFVCLGKIVQGEVLPLDDCGKYSFPEKVTVEHLKKDEVANLLEDCLGPLEEG